MSPSYRDAENAPPRDIPPLTDDEDDAESISHDRNLLHIESASNSSEDEDDRRRLPLPVWMRESAKNFKFRWVPLPLRKAGRAVGHWIKGPEPPHRMHIDPWFPHIQGAPLRLLDRVAPKKRHRMFLLILVYCAWCLTWSLMVWHNSTAGYIKDYGRPSSIWCGASFWNANNRCGLNGNNCRPFSNANMAFRCPAQCSTVKVFDPYYIGNRTVNYHGLVIGGPDPNDPDAAPIYRADSFICQAAIHAGVISDGTGGCGVATLIGAQDNYPASKQHGISSIRFPATFPRSFTFETLSASQATCPKDSRWPIFVVTAVTLVLISLFTTSPAALFFSTFVILILHVGLVSDPPNDPTFLDLISKLLGRFLPACFVAWIFYRYCSIPLLKGLTAQIEKTVLFLGFAFIGALNNYTFAPLIPLERLTPHDLKTQPGAPIALTIIIVLIVTIVGTQIYFLRQAGLLPRYLKLYISMGVGLIILLVIPGLRLRIHHYILAMLFMPGTAIQTRPGLIYQGLLLGLFVNGIARWGFDSIVQTPAALGESGGNGGGGGGTWWGATSPMVNATVGWSDQPVHLGPIQSYPISSIASSANDLSTTSPTATTSDLYSTNITFTWGPLPTSHGIEGVSILINDVERWRGYLDDELFWDETGTTIQRSESRAWGKPGEPAFFRFAWMKGGETGRYSEVGVWDERGQWRGGNDDDNSDGDEDGEGDGDGDGDGDEGSDEDDGEGEGGEGDEKKLARYWSTRTSRWITTDEIGLTSRIRQAIRATTNSRQK